MDCPVNVQFSSWEDSRGKDDLFSHRSPSRKPTSQPLGSAENEVPQRRRRKSRRERSFGKKLDGNGMERTHFNRSKSLRQFSENSESISNVDKTQKLEGGSKHIAKHTINDSNQICSPKEEKPPPRNNIKRFRPIDDDKSTLSMWQSLTIELTKKLRERRQKHGLLVQSDEALREKEEKITEHAQEREAFPENVMPTITSPCTNLSQSRPLSHLSNSKDTESTENEGIPSPSPLPNFSLGQLKVTGSLFTNPKFHYSESGESKSKENISPYTSFLPDAASNSSSSLCALKSLATPQKSHINCKSKKCFEENFEFKPGKPFSQKEELSQPQNSAWKSFRVRKEDTKILEMDKCTPLRLRSLYKSLPPCSRIGSANRSLESALKSSDDEERGAREERCEVGSHLFPFILTTQNKKRPPHSHYTKEIHLCHKNLSCIPENVCRTPGLRILDLKWNQIDHLPTLLQNVLSLEVLDMSHNALKEVDVSGLRNIRKLLLASNSIENFPKVDNHTLPEYMDVSYNRIWNLSNLNNGMAGNEDEFRSRNKSVEQEKERQPAVLKMKHNRLAGGITFPSLQNITELDVSDNGITSLDVTSLASLTSLKCSNNAIITISIHGLTLLSLTADKNRVTTIRVKNHPRRLRQLDISRNSLGSVPPWLVSCCRLEFCDVSRNAIISLPSWVTSGHLGKLRVLNANYNRLTALSSSEGIAEDSLSAFERNRTCALEVLSVHHNRLRNLPYNFFQTFNRLRILNVSSNFIQKLPPSAEDVIKPSLQELFVADNQLDELESIEICQNLRVLHAPFNHISSIEESFFWSCELLEELVISGNHLVTLPTSVARLRRLEVLRIHLNPIQSLPRLSHLTNLKVVDASHCSLGKLDFSSIVGASLTSLDIAFNPSLKVDRHQFFKCRSERSVDVVDTAGEKDRILPFQEVQSPNRDTPCVHHAVNTAGPFQRAEATPFATHLRSDSKKAANPWRIGFSETVGRGATSLTTAQLRISDLGDGLTGLVAMADGGENTKVAEKLLRSFPEALQEEKSCSPDLNDALRFALLSSLRNVFLDQKTIPVGFCSASLELEWKRINHFDARSSVSCLNADKGGGATIRFCCFGGVKAVVTSTDGPPQVVGTSNRFEWNEEEKGEWERNTECGGNVFGSSHLPNPQTKLIKLTYHHQTLIIGSSSLWEILEPEEASEICHDVGDPSLAAKRLLTLAQSYGSKKSLSVLIVSFLCNSRRNLYQHSSLSTKIGPAYKDLNLNVSDLKMNCTGMNMSRNHSKNELKTLPDTISRGNSELEESDRYPPSGQSDSDESTTETSHDIEEKLFLDIPECLLTDQQAGQLSKYVNWRSSSLRDLTSSEWEEGFQGTEKNRNESAEYPLQLITPPAAFADSDGESFSRDSGFSGNSECSMSKYLSEPCSMDINHISQVSLEQFRNWENAVDRNSKNIYLQELNSLTRGKQNDTSVSVPDLSHESKDEFETNQSRKESHSVVNNQTRPEQNPFERGLFRKSKFVKGATNFFHHKFTFGTAHKISKFSKLLCKTDNFKRFGSLQNLKHYQSSRRQSSSSPNVSQMIWSETSSNEMKEKSKLDSPEFESRIDHYWNTGVTCF